MSENQKPSNTVEHCRRRFSPILSSHGYTGCILLPVAWLVGVQPTTTNKINQQKSKQATTDVIVVSTTHISISRGATRYYCVVRHNRVQSHAKARRTK